MSAPRVCLRVGAETFCGWLAAAPGLGLPPRMLELLAGGAPAAGPGGGLLIGGSTARPSPPAVAAALAVHLDPEALILLELRESRARVLACVGAASGVAAGVVCGIGAPSTAVHGRRSGVGAEGGGGADRSWVEVSLLPADQLVDEALRWVPACPREEGAVLDLRVIDRHDAVEAPLERWRGGPRGWLRIAPGATTELTPRPAELAELAAQLRFALAGRLGGEGAAS